MAKLGRPSDYTPELADQICALIEEGVPAHRLKERNKGMPGNSALHEWLERYPDFADKYARAKERLADRYAAEVVTIADEADATAMKGIEHARTRMDARKWASGKLAPKKYGDRHKIELGGPNDGPIEVTNARARLRDLFTRARAG